MLSICWKNSSGPAAKVFVTAIFHRRNGERIPIQQRHFLPVTWWKPSETSLLDRCCTKVAKLRPPYAGTPIAPASPNRRIPLKIRLVASLVLTLCFAGVALAQTDTARLYGTITDPAGAVLPNATVTVTD